MNESRKLATIMAIDVAGYSRAMEADDRAAAQQIAELRETVRSVIAPFGGRIFNTAGDSLMIEFPAASSGVQAAIRLLAESKTGVGRLPKVRIGMHLGEVIVAGGGDLLGHGVNVAARLQALAEPGAAVVSETVRAQVRTAAEAPFTPQGRVQLDKMSERIAVYGLSLGRGRLLGKILRRRFGRVGAFALTLMLAAGFAYGAWRIWGPRAPAEQPVLAVLSFDPVGDGEVPAAFAKNFSSELHYALSRSGPGLRLIGRSSGLAFEGANKRLADIRRQLYATHVLDGAVAHQGEGVTITVELIETGNAAQVWRQRFSTNLRDVPALLVRIAALSREALRVTRTTSIAARPVDPRALELYFTAHFQPRAAYVGSLRSSVGALQQAVEIDPLFTRAWYMLAFAADYLRVFGETAEERARAERIGRTAAERYLELAPQEADAWAMAALFAADGAEAERRFNRAALLDPNQPDVVQREILNLRIRGRGEQALALADQALVLDPLLDLFITEQLAAVTMLERPHRAEELAGAIRQELAISIWPEVVMAWLAYGDRARAEVALDAYAASIEALRRDTSVVVATEDAVRESEAHVRDLRELIAALGKPVAAASACPEP